MTVPGNKLGLDDELIEVGDRIYMYVAAPFSSIRYKCEAVEVDIPYEYDDGKVSMSHVMRIKLLQRYDEKRIGIEVLKMYGVFSVRGPRSMPKDLIRKMENMHK
ncbi:hypothetical protein [Clostridium estertheticum]|nr:hypothetical protein [Clostridium estertheticum]MBU3217410.1 hypothetical protein [Clostridium estertheticum]